MSSFIGHSIAGLTLFGIQQSTDARLKPSAPQQSLWPKLAWLLGLVFLANIPDIDYLVPALRPQIDGLTLRMTHSLVGALLLPGLTVLALKQQASRPNFLLLAGLSHLGLDLMTGVSTLPLLYPFSSAQFKFPFGLLPSAGRIQLDNYFLYRNLFIELGVLVPLCLALFALWRPQLPQRRLILPVSGLVSGLFMVWAANLSR